MTTLDRYGHLLEGLDEAAADGLDEAYGRSGVGFSWGSDRNDVVGGAAK